MIRLKKQETFVFAGDSITHGGRSPSMDLNHIMGHGFPELVSARLAADNLDLQPQFVNKGVSGDTTQGIYSRWAVDVLRYRPTVISLLAGVNDIGRNYDMPPETALRKYRSTLEMILQDTFELLPDVTFFLCEPFWVDVRNQEAPFEGIPHPVCEPAFRFSNADRQEERIREYARRIAMMQQELPALAAKYGAVYVPFQDLFDEGAKKVPASYLIWDNVHPTMAGHQLLADRWLKTAAAVL